MEPSESSSPLPSPLPAPSPGFVRRAVIDVGTNSVKLLGAEGSGPPVVPLVGPGGETRLGPGCPPGPRLQPAAITQTARTVADYLTAARNWGAASTRVIATSAARDAVNRGQLLAAIEAESGCPVEVLSGAR